MFRVLPPIIYFVIHLLLVRCEKEEIQRKLGWIHHGSMGLKHRYPYEPLEPPRSPSPFFLPWPRAGDAKGLKKALFCILG